MFDEDINTYFDANGAYAGIDAGTARTIKRIRFYPRSGNPERMVGGKFQGSNTSSSSGFVDLYTVPSQPAVAWQEVDITNTTGYRYLRYLSPDGGHGNIAEAEFYYYSGGSSRVALESLTVYPNPASNVVHVKHENAGDMKATLSTLLGRSLDVKAELQNDGLSFDISSLSAGLYLLNVEVDGTSKTYKILKK